MHPIILAFVSAVGMLAAHDIRDAYGDVTIVRIVATATYFSALAGFVIAINALMG